MDYFIVRDVDTGLCMPFTKKGQTRVDLANPLVHPPRLFTSKRGATQAMHYWLRGEHHASWEYPDCDYGSGGAYVESITVRPKSDRARTRLAVFKAHMHLEAT